MTTPSTPNKADIDWNAMLAPYRKASPWRSIFQLVNTGIPFLALWLLMLWSLSRGYWITLLLAVPSGLFLVRMFIIQHDCGHGSFFKSRRANDTLGFIIGVLTLVPYRYWRRTHAIHHATSGDLDHRTFGDIDTLTVREYLSRSKLTRLRYRLYRNPVIMLGLGPIYQFILKHRYPFDTPRSWKREWASIHRTNLALLVVVTIMWFTVGIDRFLLIQLPITLISGSLGVFLFYVQHQYEDTYWRYHEGWEYYAAGLQGSSHYVLPKVLQWLTGNIGIHHIHHVSSRIPNYRLQQALDENPELQQVTRLSVGASVRTLWMTLWDEDERRLVGFRDLKAIKQRIEAASPGTGIEPGKPDAVPAPWH
ncbi:MAG: fatty acid desaturase [Gemmatimonadetes bacterium]|nr:fatty acid desaturase [Gemmatimonadota bacterium]